MQSVIAFACLLAVASAGYLNNVAPVAVAHTGSHAVAYNAPVVSAPHPVNVPFAHAYAGPLAHAYAAPIAHAYAAPIAHAVAAPAVPLASEARLVDPVAIAAGAPLPTGDTVEVAAAKAAHFQAHAAAKGLGYAAPVAHSIAHGYAAPIAHAYAAPIAHAYAAPALPLASEARLVDPVAIAAGAPLPTGDTVEVAAAKAAHFQAHAAAKGHFIAKRSPGYLHAAVAAPLAYAAPVHSYGYSAYTAPIVHSYAHTHLIAKRSPVYLGAYGYSSPLAYGYSGYASPFNYGYGRLGAFYG